MGNGYNLLFRKGITLKHLLVLLLFSGGMSFKVFSKRSGIPEIPSVAITNTLGQQFELLNSYLKNYHVYRIDVGALQEMARQLGVYAEFHLELGEYSWQFSLEKHELRSNNYKFRVATENGVEEYLRPETFTYKGIVNGNPNNTARLSIYDNQIKGLIIEDGKEYFIEPVVNYNRALPSDQFVVYHSADIASEHYGQCEYPYESSGQQYMRLKNALTADAAQACVMTEIAVAADYSMVQALGSVTGVENEIVTLLNMTEDLYDPLEIRYKLTGTFISDCSSCNPWSSTTDASSLLQSFLNWGNGGGFGNEIKYDVASLWSRRNLAAGSNTAVIGIARQPGLCTSGRYNVLEHSNSQALNVVDQTHELGHNWSAGHDSNNQSSIMSPFIGPNNQAWSQTSTNQILSYKSSSATCVSGCTVAPTSVFSADQTDGCGSLTVKFTDQSTDDPASWSWDFGDGNTSNQQNPSHTYSSPGNYTVKLTATNQYGNNTSTQTSYITVGTGSPYASVNGAASDTAMGGGGFNPAPRGLFFNAKEDIVIEKVTIYAESSGSVPVQITNSAQTVVFNTTVSLNVGKNEVTINAKVTQGNGYLIQSSGASLYRNNAGVSFPYAVGNLVDITSTNASANQTTYYYFFYNWQIRKAGCQASTGIEDDNITGIVVYPNPVNDVFNIELTGGDPEGLEIRLYNLTGEVVYEKSFGTASGMGMDKYQISLNGLSSGNYLLYVNAGDKVYNRKIMKE